ERRFAAVLVDGEYGDVVLAALEDLAAADVHGAGVAVGLVDEAAIGMDMDGARHLCVAGVGAVGERIPDEQRITRQRAVVVEPIDIKLALPLDGNEHQWLARMEVEMARPEAEPAAGR